MQNKGRVRALKKVDLVLESTDPLERLSELEKKGRYNVKFNWDEFGNGIIAICEVYYIINKKKKMVAHGSTFVPTDEVEHAKKVVAALVLDRMNLGVSDEEMEYLYSSSEEMEDPLLEEMEEKIGEMGTKVMRGALDNAINTYGEEIGLDIDNARNLLDTALPAHPEEFNPNKLFDAMNNIF